MATGGRKTQLQVTHEISAQFTPTGAFTQGQLTAGVLIGVLPAGAVIGSCHVVTPVAWNGTVSTTVSIGNAPLGAQLAVAADVRTAAARADTFALIGAAGPLAADTPIYASFVFGGTLGTLGQTVVIVEYNPAIG